jgi:adenylate cyclase
MSDRAFSYEWVIESGLDAGKLWDLISDTNYFFKAIGHLSVTETDLSGRRSSKSTRFVTYNQIHRPELWSEEPGEWEAPFYLNLKRRYHRGYLKELNYCVRISESMTGSRVIFRFTGISRGLMGRFLARFELMRGMKRRLRSMLTEYEQSLREFRFTRDLSATGFTVGTLQKKDWIHKLSAASGLPVLSDKLIELLVKSDEQLITGISPVKLARLWDKPIHDILHLLIHAADLQILNFSWDMCCPNCSGHLQQTVSLSEITEPIYCRDCENSVHVDFHSTLHLTFSPSPLVRKLSGRIFHNQNPAKRPAVKLRTVLKPGEKRFTRINLDPGTYKISSNRTPGSVYVTVQPGGAPHASIVFTNWDLEDQQLMLIGEPYLILRNQTDKPMTIICEDVYQDNYHVAASEVSSLPQFRNLFPDELIREKESIAANNLTVLFTDLFNSTDIYSENGDVSALNVVINHFDVLQKVISEERGSIVKTIGDSVMAVFPRPIYAIRAFNRAQEIFRKNDCTQPAIHLKGGVHTGNCMAVTLNNRIDYFGNTINIASRLVDHARGDEIVISDDVYTCPDLRNFLSRERGSVRIHHFDAELKGFDEKTFVAKRISLQNFPFSS